MLCEQVPDPPFRAESGAGKFRQLLYYDAVGPGLGFAEITDLPAQAGVSLYASYDFAETCEDAQNYRG